MDSWLSGDKLLKWTVGFLEIDCSGFDPSRFSVNLALGFTHYCFSLTCEDTDRYCVAAG